MHPAPLKYPRKSHRKIIKFPPENNDLAEFLGIEFGDGGIGNLWQIVISLNSISDRKYATYITQLGLRLFLIKPSIRKRPNQNTLVLVYSSMDLVNFLVSEGAVQGSKVKQQINIPNWITENSEYEKAFVRGLVDTDGCLFIHKHNVKNTIYKNIGLCFTNFSKKLIISVADILIKNDIKPYITNEYTRIYLYSSQSVVKYLKIFGSSNPRIKNKFQEWRDRLVV